jgi:hypothetical protein
VSSACHQRVPQREKKNDLTLSNSLFQIGSQFVKGKLSKHPIWVMPEDIGRAYERWDQDCTNQMSWADIFDVEEGAEHPWDIYVDGFF